MIEDYDRGYASRSLLFYVLSVPLSPGGERERDQ